MAFFSKVGNILKQTASKHISADLSASRPSIYQAIRCMSSSKLFIGGLSYATDEQSLKESFSKYGEVMEARVILDRETGRSRGFGFVTYTSSEEASSAIQALDGQELHGRTVRVNYATERRQSFGPAPSQYGYPPPYNTGGGNYGGGNYGAPGGNYGGNYSGGGYSAGGDSQGSGGNYGSNYGGGSYGSGGGGGGGNYGSAGNYAGGNTYEGGNSGAYGSSNAAAGGVASDTYVSSVASTGLPYSGGDQFGSNESSSMGDPAGGYTPEDKVEGNYRDDDDDTGDYAKRA